MLSTHVPSLVQFSTRWHEPVSRKSARTARRSCRSNPGLSAAPPTRLAFVWAGSPVTPLQRDEQILVLAPLNPASAIERVEHCTFTEPPLADDIVVDAELLGNGQKDARA